MNCTRCKFFSQVCHFLLTRFFGVPKHLGNEFYRLRAIHISLLILHLTLKITKKEKKNLVIQYEAFSNFIRM